MAGGEASAGDEWCAGWGRWQARLAALLALPVLLTGAYSTNYVFLAAPAAHRCLVPECEGARGAWSARPAPWAAWALPEEQCRRRRPLGAACEPHSFHNTSTIACDRFVYEPSGSIVVELGLGCAEWKRSLVGTVHNVGMLVSLPILGLVSDTWGRRAALVVSGAGAGCVGLAKSFVSSYPAYLAAEFLETALGASVYPAAFVLMIEWLGVQQRVLASLVLGVPLALGAALLALLDLAAGSWRLWARCAYPPSLLLLLYPWLLPESVRWLVARGRGERALAEVRRAAAANGVPLPPDAAKRVLAAAHDDLGQRPRAPPESLLRALIRYRALRVRLAVCVVWWVSAVFVFYGLAANAHALAGSRHANYALLALAQLPALAANTLLLDRVGRRALLTAALLLTAAALTALSLAAGAAATALYVLGQAGATMTLNALYVYTAELFPTPARHRLLAACSTAGRLGAILAPLTPLLRAYGAWIPALVFGALPLVSAALTRAVPDTLRRRLPHSFADMQHADLQHADLQHADLQHADLQHADMQHADLQHADHSADHCTRL